MTTNILRRLVLNYLVTLSKVMKSKYSLSITYHKSAFLQLYRVLIFLYLSGSAYRIIWRFCTVCIKAFWTIFLEISTLGEIQTIPYLIKTLIFSQLLLFLTTAIVYMILSILYYCQFIKLVTNNQYQSRMQLSSQKGSIQVVLDLQESLKGNKRPKELENFIQDCSGEQELIMCLLEAIQTQELNDKQLQLVCMIIAKALALDNLSQECQLKIFVRMILNWSLPAKSKQFIQGDLIKFSRYVERQNLNYLFQIIYQLQKLINQIFEERTDGIYESEPLQIVNEQLKIVVKFPKEFVPMAQTYIFFLKNVLLPQAEQQQIMEVTQDFSFLKTLHKLIFEAKNITAYPELFYSLFSFYIEFFEVQAQKGIEKSPFQNWDFLTQNLSLVYESLCKPFQKEGVNYLSINPHKYSQSIMSVKSQASQFHANLLSNLSKRGEKSSLFEQLILMHPSIVKTITGFLQNNNNLGQEEYFIKNMLVLLSFNLQNTKYEQKQIFQIFRILIVPFLEYVIDTMQQTITEGQQLHFLLDDCCQVQPSGHLLTEAIMVTEKMFAKYPELHLHFYTHAEWSIKQRFAQKQFLSDDQKQRKPMQSRVVFLLLTISAYYDHQNFVKICIDLGNIIDRKLLQNLRQAELPYFFYFLQNSLDFVCQPNPNLYEIFVDFVLTNRNENQEYYLLSFMKSFFQSSEAQQIEQSWVIGYVCQMPNFRKQECRQLKWEIISIILSSKLKKMDTKNIVWIIQQITAGAQRQLERMICQKKHQIKVQYGQVKQFLGCLRNLEKQLQQRIFQKQILLALYSFLELIDRATLASVEKDIVNMTYKILAFYQSMPEIAEKSVQLLEKLMISLIQNHYETHITIFAIFSYLNTFPQQKQANELSLGLLTFGTQFLVNNAEKPEMKYFNRSLSNLLTLFQKYLVTFEINNQNRQQLGEIFEKFTSVCYNLVSKQTQTSQPSLEVKRIAVKYNLLKLVFSMRSEKQIEVSQLMQFARQKWFLNYNAFLLLGVFKLLIADLAAEMIKSLLQVGIQILATHQLYQVGLFEHRNAKKLIISNTKNSKDPFEQIHLNVDKRLYKKNVAQQVWSLFQALNIHSWSECQTLFPSFHQNYFSFLEFCRNKPTLEKQQQLIDYNKKRETKAKLINEELKAQVDKLPKYIVKQKTKQQEIVQKRKIVKVTGDKSSLANSSLIQSKISFKRDILRFFIEDALQNNRNEQIREDQNSFSEDSQPENEKNLPTKKIIDNYRLQHKLIRGKAQLQSFQPQRRESNLKNRRQQMRSVLAAAELKRLSIS